MSILDHLAEELTEAKAAKAAAEDRIKDITAKIVDVARERGDKSVEAETSKGRIRLTVVTTERLSYNDAKLKELLGKRFKKVRSDKVDPDKLSNMLIKGVVKEEEVRECLTLTKSRPYLRSSAVGSTQQQGS